MTQHWPLLSYEKGKDTYETLQLFTQIVGKLKLATLPWVNHSWHVALYITPRGLTTQAMPYQGRSFQVDFDFRSHELQVITSDDDTRSFALAGLSVAGFYKKIFELLAELALPLRIMPVPVEIVDPIPFEDDEVHATYDKDQVSALHVALLQMQEVFMEFRSDFKGKSSPFHFFWGSFDMALSFFSGKEAPKHPGGVPGLPNWVAEEAYCREVSSCGFWPGNASFPEAAFYCYHYPEPEGYKTGTVEPEEAYYHQTLSEYILPYAAVQSAKDPAEKLTSFLKSTYQIGANLAQWDRNILDEFGSSN
ncbi:hypothetical protein IWX76_002463 [Pedobacter sp. CAN_A7]|uniref:DUF5996 family protein n=1 Tax=Pedobacter sp. CAN_A7 TaxID=2787722 RepID=UPI0018CA6630